MLTATLVMEEQAERRGAERVPIGQRTIGFSANATPFEIVVLDLSSKGAQFEALPELAVGDRVSIGIPAIGARDARIVRRRGTRFGCLFDAPLSTAEIDHAFSADPAFREAFSEPVIRKWQLPLSLALMLGASAAVWAIVVHLL